MKEIILNEGLTTLNGYVFNECKGLTSITLPATLKSIKNAPFNGCINLQNIQIADGNTSFVFEDGALYNSAKTVLIAYLRTNTNTTYTMPYSVTTISAYVFEYQPYLTKVILSSNLQTIGTGSFYRCEKLTEVDFSKCIQLNEIGTYAFYDTAITSVTIPSTVTKIGQLVFSHCNKLTSITFGDTSTWYYGTSAQQEAMSGGTQLDVSNQSANATYFTSTYVNKYWYKI